MYAQRTMERRRISSAVDWCGRGGKEEELSEDERKM
jgi:hypothetical protein